MWLKAKDFYAFDNFRIDLAERVLLREDSEISLTPKVFDTLLVLIENAGRIVEKEELIRKVWQERFVQENNLTFNIKMLRKALGDSAGDPRFIETIPRRGYRFIGKVEKISEDTAESIAKRKNIETTLAFPLLRGARKICRPRR